MCVAENRSARKALLKPNRKPKRLLKRNLAKAYPSNRKERGEWVELLFMATAARLGLKVMRPHGDSARFDVVVEDGRGSLHRVQVKSTTFQGKNGCYECVSWWSKATLRVKRARDGTPAGLIRVGQSQRYSEEQIDFLAGYVVPEDAWFIIPASEIRTKTLYLPPREQPERNRYGQFLEAWSLLGADGTGLTIHASVENDLLLELLRAKVAEEAQQARSADMP